MSKILAGKKAPLFTLTDAAGKSHSLAEALRRGPAVVAFFKITCPVCQFTFPFIERLFEHYKSEPSLTFWGISQDDAPDTSDFAGEFDVTFPLLLDDESSYAVSNDYGLTNVPTIFLIAPDGTVKIASVGFDKSKLERIDAELAKHTSRSLAPVFRPSDIVPAQKPG